MSIAIEITGYVPCTLRFLTAAERAVRGDNVVAVMHVAGRKSGDTQRLIWLTSDDTATIRRALAQLSDPVTS